MLNRRDLLRTAGFGAVAIGTGALTAPVALASSQKVLKTTWQQQKTGYYCGPTAVAIAVSAKTTPPSQDALASEMGTTSSAGTGRDAVIRALTNHVPGATYHDQNMPSTSASQADADLLWSRATKNVDGGFATVCNWMILAGQYPNWGGNAHTIYHYTVIDGYDPDGKRLHIKDPAGVVLSSSLPHEYWLTAQQVANFCAGRGYAW